MDKFDLVTEYNTLLSKYAKLCDFLKRVEDGSSPIHDDYPVSGLYEQQKQMQNNKRRRSGRFIIPSRQNTAYMNPVDSAPMPTNVTRTK